MEDIQKDEQSALQVAPGIEIPLAAIDISAIRAQGKGGQNVNKVSTAQHLRFNFKSSPFLPDYAKQQLGRMRDSRITQDGWIIIKAQRYRTQLANRRDALDRLRELIEASLIKPKARKPTKISRGAKLRRQASKKRQSEQKQLRKKLSTRHY